MNLCRRLESGEFDYRAWLRLAKQIKAEWNVDHRNDPDLARAYINVSDPVSREKDIKKLAADLHYYSDRWFSGRFLNLHLAMRQFRDNYTKGLIDREFRCPLCGYERTSIRKHPKCNHNQEEEGIPYPVTEMVLIPLRDQ